MHHQPDGPHPHRHHDLRRSCVAINAVLGSRADPAIAEKLHQLEHLGGQIERVTVTSADLARHRLRVRSDKGTEFLFALPRHVALFDGAVVLLEERRAAVVAVDAERWLRLTPASAADALELGYHAGNLHWRVRFDAADLLVALEASKDDYLARIAPLVARGRVKVREPEYEA